MTVTIDYYVEDIENTLLKYDQVRLYRGTSPTGSFATIVDTVSLQSGQTLYALNDSNGTINDVYVVDFYHDTLGTTSSQSAPFYPVGASLLRLRIEAARRANAGFEGVCTAAGTTTTLVDTVLQDTGIDAHFLDGSWVYRPNASVGADRLRRVKPSGFNPATGTLSFTRAYTNPPGNEEVYQVFNFYPPIPQSGVGMSWDAVIRDAMMDVWYTDRVEIGNGTVDWKRRFSLSDVVGSPAGDIRGVYIRTTDSHGNIRDRDAGTNGGYWEVVQNGPGDVSIDVVPPPSQSEIVVVEVNRRDSALYNDTDMVSAPFEYAVAAVVRRLFWQLNIDQPGKYSGELLGAQQLLDRAAGSRPGPVIRGI